MLLHYPSFDLDLDCCPILYPGQTHLSGQLWISASSTDTLTNCWLRICSSRKSRPSLDTVVQILPTSIVLQKGKEVVLPFRVPIVPPSQKRKREGKIRDLLRADLRLEVMPESTLTRDEWQTATPMHALAV